MSSTSRPPIYSSNPSVLSVATRRKAIEELRSSMGDLAAARIRNILRTEGDSGLNETQYAALDLALQDARKQELGTVSTEQSTVDSVPSYGIIPDSFGNVHYQPVPTQPVPPPSDSILSQTYLSADGLQTTPGQPPPQSII